MNEPEIFKDQQISKQTEITNEPHISNYDRFPMKPELQTKPKL
jgi:hypothetical protein